MDGNIRFLDMLRPRVKPEHVPYVTVDGNVRIGATVHGVGAEIEDPDGWVRVLVGGLDGTRSPDEVLALVKSSHGDVPVAEAADAMQQLLDAGFVEDAGAPVPAQLSERERERYSRGMAFFDWIDQTPRSSPWDIQLRLSRSRVLLIGVGGTGGAVAQGLVASGVGYLHCVDSDTVELSNLNRQVLYREDDIGKPKVDAAMGHLRALNSDVEVTGERRQVDGEADIADLLRPGYDLVALCADQPRPIRRWANRVCLAAGMPWVTGGYHGPLTSAGLYIPGRGACWECLHDQEVEQADMRLPAGVPLESLGPQLPWQPVNVVSAAITGNLLTHFALAVLTGAPPIEPGFRYGVNLAIAGESVLDRYDRRPDCPTCGDTP
ncbi:ThiF family adenylyltransferase [Nocardia sp. NBC_01730]|uniref:HesA/MoeB/ThiF family protein n=1 Tax=Nocardia sp. NBC_01730 TaxID=2975998 RepID=UPI002E142654|nr:ThiF family adenylyltransferase [Nocardia sp. NBC_01730]